MGLPSLKSKIERKINQDNFSEEDVLYMVAEVRKYIERSGKELGDPDKLKVDRRKFETIKFFRNWILHPEKHSHDLDEFLKSLTAGAKEGVGNDVVEIFLLEKLAEELVLFCSDIDINVTKVKHLSKTNFFEQLKLVLHEQPIHRLDGTSVGYDEGLRFTVL